MTIHHATRKKAEAAGIELKEFENTTLEETWVQAVIDKDTAIAHPEAKTALEAAVIKRTLAAEYPTLQLHTNAENGHFISWVKTEEAPTPEAANIIRNKPELPTLADILDAAQEKGFDPEAGYSEEDEPRGNGVPKKYKMQYMLNEDPDSCSDELAMAFKDYVTGTNEKGKGCLDMEKLREVAKQNGCEEKLEQYEAKGLNSGMCRMNIGNIIRAKLKRGEEVAVGEKVWAAVQKD